MQPVPRKHFVECPRCRSPEVHVPWEPGASRRRRHAFYGLVILWMTSFTWVVLSLRMGVVAWVAGLAFHLLVTAVVGVAVYYSAHTHRCGACRLRWRA